ncbi:MAG: hypothetical protein ACRD07_22000, partial [Acidimicrobiales bacterium]
MTTLYDEFARRRPEAVVRRGGETFVGIDAADEFISEAERQGIRILGLEGFLIADDGVYPALSRLADSSDVTDAQQSAALARELILGPWRTPPTPVDQMSERHVAACWML